MQDTIIKITMSLNGKRKLPQVESLPIIYRGNGFYKCKGTSDKIFIASLNQPLRNGDLSFSYYYILPDGCASAWECEETTNAVLSIKAAFEQEFIGLSYILKRQYINAILKTAGTKEKSKD